MKTYLKKTISKGSFICNNKKDIRFKSSWNEKCFFDLNKTGKILYDLYSTIKETIYIGKEYIIRII